MVRKFFLVLFFATLFGLITTASAFASRPPRDGIWESSGGGSIVLVYMSSYWSVDLFDNRGNMVGSLTTTDYNSAPSNGYFIRFSLDGRRIVLRYRGNLEVIQGHLPRGVGSLFRLTQW